MAAMAARTLRPEDEISHYRIVGPLGAGGMGEVYLAQDQSLGRNVALKILPPHLVRSEERLPRFVLEAKSASSLSHPSIVTIHEIGLGTVRSAGEHAWSPDGRRLGILVRAGERVDLWVTDAEGRKPVRVTQISPEVISRFTWMADSRRLVVEASTRPSDVVLIRDFR